ncbi:MAG: hypothetical protein FWG20_02165 [Candidatus Cloacimonetes bacterium]|nr:hypothetical protein [Candidatus Cloacimonadota bacterium]
MISASHFYKIICNRCHKRDIETKLAGFGFEKIHDRLYRYQNYTVRLKKVDNLYRWSLWKDDVMLFLANNQDELLQALIWKG